MMKKTQNEVEPGNPALRVGAVSRRSIYGQLKAGAKFWHDGMEYRKVFASQSCPANGDFLCKWKTFSYWQMVTVTCG